MRKIFIYSCLFLLSVKLHEASVNYLNDFNKANELYAKGSYSQAINIYESIRADNENNSSLFYNLGNAYFKNQQIGYAILNYERALKFSPRDTDIQHNLKFVRQLMNEPAPSFYSSVISSITNFATLNEITILCSFFYFIFAVGFTLYLFQRKKWLILFNLISLSLLILFSIWLLIKADREIRTKWAIVVNGSVEVRNGPGLENSVGFSVPEGRKIMILGEKDSWTAIGLESEGLKGWVEKKNIDKI